MKREMRRRGFLGGLAALLAVPFAGTALAEKPRAVQTRPRAQKLINETRTLAFTAKQAAEALSMALGPCILMGQSHGLEVGQEQRYVEFVPGGEAQAIETLVEACKWRKFKRFWLLDVPYSQVRCAVASSKASGIAVRVAEIYNVGTDQTTLRLDVIGAGA